VEKASAKTRSLEPAAPHKEPKPASDCEVKVADAAQPRGMQDLPRAKASEIDACDPLEGQVLLCLDAIIRRPSPEKDGHQEIKEAQAAQRENFPK
jgi:hypothetical protein